MNYYDKEANITFNFAFEILLIEDNEADVDLTREAIVQQATQVHLHVANTGEEGLQFLSRSGRFKDAPRPDLILLDLNLPGMDGREVLSKIKNDPSFKQIPVVILTTSEADLDIVKSYSLGANCYIVKPVDFESFLRIVGQIENFWFNVVKLPTQSLVEKYTSSTANFSPISPIQMPPSHLIRVLHIEDSDADADLVVENLVHLNEPRFLLHRELRLSDAFSYLDAYDVDVVLLDLSLPDSHGTETLVKFLAKAPKLPVIVLTGLDDKTLGAWLVRAGAQDYLFKEHIQSEILVRVILHAIERKINAIMQAEAFEREHIALNEAKKAIEMRDDFFSIASHELRTPLTSLKLQIQLLAKILTGGESKEELKDSFKNLVLQVLVQIDRFSHLVETLFDFSQIQLGRLKLQYLRFDLNEMVRTTVEQLKSELKSAGCEVKLNLGESVIGEWDRLRLEQVVVNLISNAMKYARGKPIDVLVSSNQKNAWIQVKDYGPGIPSEDREKVFQKYERGLGLKSISGLGLGLYVVKQIVDMHGGTVHVESQIGAGATFIVCIPLRIAQVESIA